MEGGTKMSQWIHTFIAIILFNITWHVFLKKLPAMKELTQSWQTYFLEEFF